MTDPAAIPEGATPESGTPAAAPQPHGAPVSHGAPQLHRAPLSPVPSVLRFYDPALAALARGLLPFYRRFPYRGPMAITRIDPRGAAIPPAPGRRGLFYSRIPKAANSTISRILAEQSGYARRFAGRNPKDRFLRPSHLNRAEVAALEAEWLKFTFVRNPYTRTLSAFLDKIRGRKPQSRPFYAWFGGGEPGYLDFCRFLEAGGLWADMHWAPQSGILLLPLERFDFIGRLERLEEDLSTLLPMAFGPEVRLEMRRAGPSSGANARRAEHFSPEAQAIVARLYAQDFAAFGYDPALWP